MESVKGELDTEKSVVRRIKEECEKDRPKHLKKIYAHVNLATRKFHEIWQDWWKMPLPPRLEVDIIPVFQMENVSDEVFMAGVEVKYFKDNKRGFYEGLQQALAFGAFGFDSLALWHIFSSDLKNEEIQSFSRVVEEIIEPDSIDSNRIYGYCKNRDTYCVFSLLRVKKAKLI